MKTSELTGVFLDWAVTKAEGLSHDFEGPKGIWGCHGWATNWEMGGPIIEREKIAIDWDHDCWNASTDDHPAYYSATTPLIAAMRCYVASQLGDEVDIPEELKEVA